MHNDTRFLDLNRTYGGKPGKPSSVFLDWLRSHGLSEQAVAVVSRYVLGKAGGVRALNFYSEKEILGANDKDFVPIAIRDGLLIVGGCPNGDPVAIDVREHLGAAGYICHETMWHVASVREVFFPFAASLDELAAILTDDDPPYDYYHARDRYGNQTEPK